MIDTDLLRRLQTEVAEWSVEQFGDREAQPAKFPCVGAGEELGELSRSVLKRAQGIDDSEKYADSDDVGPEAERDAVGDVVIYLADTMARAEDDIWLADGYEKLAGDYEDGVYSHVDDPLDMVQGLYVGFGDVAGSRFHLISQEEWEKANYEWKSEEDDLELVAYRAARVVAGLERFCELRGYDLETCIEDAWTEVSDREWDADTGGD